MPVLMKGHTWSERRDAVDRKGNPIVTYPVNAEDKHDEIRCHVTVVGQDVTFLSYAGKPLSNMLEFAHLFLTLAEEHSFNEFDCGFEVNGNFNDSYRWVRSTKGLPSDLKCKPCTVQFYLFDLPECSFPQLMRDTIRHALADGTDGWLKVPSYTLCDNAHDVENAFLNARARGLEGLMVKQRNAEYQRGKRTDGWLKMKNSNTYDGKIVGFVEAVSAEGVPHGRVGSVVLELEDGSTASPHGLAHELATRMWDNQLEYLGQWVEFDAMEIDRQGGYRHPIFRRLREPKD